MDTIEETPVPKDDYDLEGQEPSPVQEEYAPVIFAQDTISHIVSLDMLSGKVNFLSIVCGQILASVATYTETYLYRVPRTLFFLCIVIIGMSF